MIWPVRQRVTQGTASFAFATYESVYQDPRVAWTFPRHSGLLSQQSLQYEVIDFTAANPAIALFVTLHDKVCVVSVSRQMVNVAEVMAALCHMTNIEIYEAIYVPIGVALRRPNLQIALFSPRRGPDENSEAYVSMSILFT